MAFAFQFSLRVAYAYRVLCLCLVAATTGVPAVAGEFRAQCGTVLPAPDIASLNCAEQEALMRMYTDRDYRKDAQPAEDHPDREIFDYENRLADSFYSRCLRGAFDFRALTPAFSKGFN